MLSLKNGMQSGSSIAQASDWTGLECNNDGEGLKWMS